MTQVSGSCHPVDMERRESPVIVGVGAIGTLLALRLAHAGLDPLLVLREPIAAPRASLQLDAPGGPSASDARWTADLSSLPSADWTLLATKAHQVGSAGAAIQRATRNGGRLAVFQNGVEHRARVVDDLDACAWGKLCVGVVAAILAVTERPHGVLREPGMTALARELVAECAAVARSAGVALPHGTEAAVVD
jgi:ketopantoate reductase